MARIFRTVSPAEAPKCHANPVELRRWHAPPAWSGRAARSRYVAEPCIDRSTVKAATCCHAIKREQHRAIGGLEAQRVSNEEFISMRVDRWFAYRGC